ncbi:MAG: TonB family protein [Myxococcales bacterium]
MSTPLGLTHDQVPEAASTLRSHARERAATKLRHGGSVVVAVLCHAGLAWLALHAEVSPKQGPMVVTEVSLLPPAPPPPPAPEPPPKLEEPKPVAPEPRPVRARAPSAPKEEPKAASAAPLLTAPEETPDSQEPVRFVTDPNGSAFGYGVVARGGTAKEGLGASTAKPAPVAAPVVDPNAPFRGELGRAPKLTMFDPCRGFFPERAQSDRGDAAVRVTVAADGSVRAVSVLAERPLSQGFGPAARACLLAARFEPALDTSGRAVVAVAPITVKFSR